MAKLRKALTALLEKETISAHMPGHKGIALHTMDWFTLDTTEIDGTDNLHAPSGILKEAMVHCAQVYGAAWSHFLINGSTVGVMAAMLGTLKPGDKVIIGRDCHRSVYSAIALQQLEEVVVMPEVSRFGEMLGYRPEAILEALSQHPEAKVVVLTSPTYFGYCTPLNPILAALEHRGGTLIVDEAHGAHLAFSGAKDLSALTQGAHIVIHSAHKTLPAMTQTGILHFGHSCPEVTRARVLERLSMLQSTSPSYVLMSSIEEAVSWMDAYGAQSLSELESHLNQVRRGGFADWVSPTAAPQDPFKLWLATERMGYDGYSVHHWLTTHGVNPELTNAQGVLLYLTVMNTPAEIDRISTILALLPKKEVQDQMLSQCHWCDIPRPKRQMNQFEVDAALDSGTYSRVQLDAAVGKISARRLVPYPPGVPLLLPGELIEQAHIDYLKSLAPHHVVLGEDGREALWCIDIPSHSD